MKKNCIIVLLITMVCAMFVSCEKSEKNSQQGDETKTSSTIDSKVYEDVTVQEITFPSETRVERTDKGDLSETLKFTSLKVNDGEYDFEVYCKEFRDDLCYWSSEEMQLDAVSTFYVHQSDVEADLENCFTEAPKAITVVSTDNVNGFTVFEMEAPKGEIGYMACRDYGKYKYQIILYNDNVNYIDKFKDILEKVRFE